MMKYADQKVRIMFNGEAVWMSLARYMAHVAAGALVPWQSAGPDSNRFRMAGVLEVDPNYSHHVHADKFRGLAFVWAIAHEGIILQIPKAIPLKVEFDVNHLRPELEELERFVDEVREKP